MWDSNPRHPTCKAGVLPTELMAHKYWYPVLVTIQLQPPYQDGTSPFGLLGNKYYYENLQEYYSWRLKLSPIID